jgi:hypothetical protein
MPGNEAASKKSCAPSKRRHGSKSALPNGTNTVEMRSISIGTLVAGAQDVGDDAVVILAWAFCGLPLQVPAWPG